MKKDFIGFEEKDSELEMSKELIINSIKSKKNLLDHLRIIFVRSQ
jgi:hypothetical protein